MATAVVMPKLGNSVESSIIVGWKKQVGDTVKEGDALCEVETDKTTVDVESPASGVLLAQFFKTGDDVPVMVNIAAIGQSGENVDHLRPGGAVAAEAPVVAVAAVPLASPVSETVSAAVGSAAIIGISPRARNLAERKTLNLEGINGSGPGGRIIERDVLAALERQPKLTPVAKSMVEAGEFVAPAQGSGPGGRVTKKDLIPTSAPAESPALAVAPASAGEVETLPLKGVRKVIAGRMLNSLQTTAQLTMNAFADARDLQAYRARLKASDESLGLRKVTINDLVMYAVARTLPQFRDINGWLKDETIYRYADVHLGFAVDTPRGLMVPVIRNANHLNLKQLSAEAARLAAACQEGKIKLDELDGGTFTVSNLGAFGVETFTPVLNPPQVAILGVGNIHLKAVELDEQLEFIPSIGLSLTVDHQIVDGAPGARFLQALARNIAQFELLLAV